MARDIYGNQIQTQGRFVPEETRAKLRRSANVAQAGMDGKPTVARKPRGNLGTVPFRSPLGRPIGRRPARDLLPNNHALLSGTGQASPVAAGAYLDPSQARSSYPIRGDLEFPNVKQREPRYGTQPSFGEVGDALNRQVFTPAAQGLRRLDEYVREQGGANRESTSRGLYYQGKDAIQEAAPAIRAGMNSADEYFKKETPESLSQVEPAGSDLNFADRFMRKYEPEAKALAQNVSAGLAAVPNFAKSLTGGELKRNLGDALGGMEESVRRNLASLPKFSTDGIGQKANALGVGEVNRIGAGANKQIVPLVGLGQKLKEGVGGFFNPAVEALGSFSGNQMPIKAKVVEEATTPKPTLAAGTTPSEVVAQQAEEAEIAKVRALAVEGAALEDESKNDLPLKSSGFAPEVSGPDWMTMGRGLSTFRHNIKTGEEVLIHGDPNPHWALVGGEMRQVNPYAKGQPGIGSNMLGFEERMAIAREQRGPSPLVQRPRYDAKGNLMEGTDPYVRETGKAFDPRVQLENEEAARVARQNQVDKNLMAELHALIQNHKELSFEQISAMNTNTMNQYVGGDEQKRLKYNEALKAAFDDAHPSSWVPWNK